MSTEFGKIETLYERDEKTHKLKQPLVLKNPTYGLLKTWHWTEKIDGTNIRLIWQGGKLTIGGKTDNANIPAGLVNYLQEAVTSHHMQNAFTYADGSTTDAVVYGEGYGAGIQGGGGYCQDKRFIVFDVLVAGKWWLSHPNVVDVAGKLKLPTVPFMGVWTLEEATAIVRDGFVSRLAKGQRQAEGLVGRPAECLFDKKGHRLITKIKTRDF